MPTTVNQTQESEGTPIDSSLIPKTGGGTLANTEECSPPKDFRECCFEVRDDITVLKLRVKTLKGNVKCTDGSPEHPIDYGEVVANLQLSYRHLEDARMRLGKAVQAYDGGESCYPR